MRNFTLMISAATAGIFVLAHAPGHVGAAYAQETAAAATTEAEATDEADEPLTEEELEVLVARIALYPDELVAAIVAASLYPLQIVQAERYLEDVKTKKDLKPDRKWDGSVVSLLNYPEVVKMMNDDLEWTEQLGDAVTNQEKDVLAAIQQLRDKAVAQGTLKSDEKTTVVQQADSVVIQPAKADEIYVPVYQPQMLYEPDYPPQPVTYYPEPYPSYYYPTAPYFPAFITGAVWGAAIDWDDWNVWDGDGGWGNDIDIDCNNCFNDRDFNGKINWNDVDWSKVDRSKINFDRSQFNKIDRNKIRDDLRTNDRNRVKNKAADLKRQRPSSRPGKAGAGTRDVRKSALEGLQKGDRQGAQNRRPADGAGNRPANRADGRPADRASNRPTQKFDKKAAGQKARQSGKVNRSSGKGKPAARVDNRPKKPSPMGDINRGRNTKFQSNRGGRGMGGGLNMGGGGRPQMHRGGGGGHQFRRGGGGGRRR